MGNCYQFTHQWDKALKHYEQSLEVLEKLHGKGNPVTAIVMKNIALLKM